MARSTPRWLTSRNMLAISVLALAFNSVLPASVGRYFGWLKGPADTILSPIQAPIYRGILALLPTDEGRSARQATEAELRLQLDICQTEQGRLQSENEVLKRVIIDLQQGQALNLSMDVRPLVAAVIGPSADASGGLITLRAGKRQGVETNSVVVSHGVHLVGRVTSISERTCKVIPITDRSAGSIAGVIMLDPLKPGPPCPSLFPTGGGKLRGEVLDYLDPATQSPPPLAKGMVVRLDDKTWPESAQQLVVGVIDSIEFDKKQSPLRQIITVAPFYRLDRLSEATIRIPIEAGGSPGGAPR